eukprot:352803-Chlamydomonas_euryale.AAC.2
MDALGCITCARACGCGQSDCHTSGCCCSIWLATGPELAPRPRPIHGHAPGFVALLTPRVFQVEKIMLCSWMVLVHDALVLRWVHGQMDGCSAACMNERARCLLTE